MESGKKILNASAPSTNCSATPTTTVPVAPLATTPFSVAPLTAAMSYVTTTTSNLRGESSVLPLRFSTVISPEGRPEASFTVTTPNAYGHKGVMSHFQQVQYVLGSMYWHTQTHTSPRESPRASSSSSAQKRQRVEPPKFRKRWCPTPTHLELMSEMFRKSEGQVPSWDDSLRIAELLKPFGEIEGANVYFWFRNQRVRGGQQVTEPPMSSKISAPLSLFPQRAGNISENRDHRVTENVVPSTASDNSVRLELCTRPTQ